MTQTEIDAMSNEEFKAISPFEKKSCHDCSFIKVYVGLWCTNEDSFKARGTRFPGGIKCPYWAPDWKRIDGKYKTKENGFK